MSKQLVLRGIDLIKGATKQGRDFSSSLLYDAMPWQMVNLEDKTPEWKAWCADYFEWVGIRQISQKSRRIHKHRMLAAGILDMEDYTINGDESHTYLNNMFIEQEFIDPLKKFYPLIPPFINVLKGDFIKRNRKVYVKCVDRYTENQKLQVKMEQVNQIILKDGLQKKERALREMGLVPVDPESVKNSSPEEQQQALQANQQFEQEMEIERELIQSQQKFKNYRHVMEEFAQLILNKDRERFHMAEMEEEAFVEMLCNSEVAIVLEMGEIDYKPRFIDNAKSFYHISSDLKYYSEGDYFGWFEEVSIGDIINAESNSLTEEQFDKLKEISSLLYGFDHKDVNARLITDMEKTYDNPYYDASKKYPNSKVDIAKTQFVHNEMIKDILSGGTNMSTPGPVSQYLNSGGANSYLRGVPKLFRKMSLFYKSQRKIGYLTKKDRSGQIVTKGGLPLWVDESFQVTVPPIYDNSITKENSAENLIYGEHIDWTWVNEWRFIKKYSPNHLNTTWQSESLTDISPIYVGGDPIISPFQSTDKNILSVEPPFEGITWKLQGIRPVSFVENLAPFQILTNICINRVPDIIADDIGLALWMSHNSVQNTNTLGPLSDGDPLENALDQLRNFKMLTTRVDRDLIRDQGNAAPVVPQVLNLSRIKEADDYLRLAMQLKEMAGETVGVSRQRLAQSKASESATQTQQGINFSEVQTEPLFHQFLVRFMPRIYQKMIEAGMYYASKFESAREFYQTSAEGNAFLEVENLENSLRRYSVIAEIDPNTQELNKKLESLFINNNTTETDMYDLARGLVDDTPAQKLENLRKAKLEREKREEDRYKQEMELEKERSENLKKHQELIHQQNKEIEEIRAKSDEQVAIIRAMGGIQTDANEDGMLDAFQNLQNKIAELRGKVSSNTDKLALDRDKHQDLLSLKKEELRTKASIEHKKLGIALVNQNKNDDKSLNKQVAKKQGVS